MLAAGTVLGPYRILAPLGSGGMGEVYRAHDTRLRRDVAVKVIHAEVALDPERIRRFEQEARAAGALSHPNVCATYDLGTYDGTPYVVMELLEGTSMRGRLAAGPISVRKALDYVAQAAHGLSAAHEKGIIHRDLKPENLFVTHDGRVKVLDFGLAKLTRPDALGLAGERAASIAATASGTILGTVGYMAPEQVRGQPADARSDLFALGAILYELLTGKRAFEGASQVETLGAILNQEPPPLALAGREVPVLAERLLRRCLEKNPNERFQSASDVAFALEAVVDPTESGLHPAPATADRRKRPGRLALTLVLAAALLASGAWLAARTMKRPPPPEFRRLTYARGGVGGARFAADGSTIVYSAAWGGNPEELYTTRVENPGARALELGSARILALSAGGELAVALRPRVVTVFERIGTLARVPLAGGAPRELLENVLWADWSPDGRELAVVHDLGGQRLEYPIGRVLYRAAGWISHPRVSPDGKLVAFIDHPFANDDRGAVAVVDRAGRKRSITSEKVSIQGLAWTPRGNEILFTATMSGFARSLHKVGLSGRELQLARVPNGMTVQDIARDGRVLISVETFRFDLRGLAPGESQERDLSWLDHSYPSALSADGRTLLISEWAEAAGDNGTVCVRGTDGSPAIPLGNGQGFALSPDGRWALAHQVSSPQYVLLPTGPGSARAIPRAGLEHDYGAAWLPDGRSILFSARSPTRPPRLYVQGVDGGEPRPVTPEGVVAERPLVTPDGGEVWVGDSLYRIEGGPAQPAPKLPAGERPLRWSAERRTLFTSRFDMMNPSVMEIHRRDLITGSDALHRRIELTDPAGIAIDPVLDVSRDGRSYVYMINRLFSDLYLMSGLD